jgi:phosphate transport system permease protein
MRDLIGVCQVRRDISCRVCAGQKDRQDNKHLADIMVSVPSIVIGTFIYAILVRPIGRHFNGWAGAVALSI